MICLPAWSSRQHQDFCAGLFGMAENQWMTCDCYRTTRMWWSMWLWRCSVDCSDILCEKHQVSKHKTTNGTLIEEFYSKLRHLYMDVCWNLHDSHGKNRIHLSNQLSTWLPSWFTQWSRDIPEIYLRHLCVAIRHNRGEEYSAIQRKVKKRQDAWEHLRYITTPGQHNSVSFGQHYFEQNPGHRIILGETKSPSAWSLDVHQLELNGSLSTFLTVSYVCCNTSF